MFDTEAEELRKMEYARPNMPKRIKNYSSIHLPNTMELCSSSWPLKQLLYRFPSFQSGFLHGICCEEQFQCPGECPGERSGERRNS
jgi:hypothetical protein